MIAAGDSSEDQSDGIMVTVHAAENDEFSEETMNTDDESIVEAADSMSDGDWSQQDGESEDEGRSEHDESFGSVKIRPLLPDHEERENAEMVERCKRNPLFMSMVVDMVKTTLKSETSDSVGKPRMKSKNVNNENGNSNQFTPSRPNKGLNQTVKSPSDTTLYAPGLNKRIDTERDNIEVVNVLDKHAPNGLNQDKQLNLIDQISDFVDSVRLEVDTRGDAAIEPGTSTSRKDERQLQMRNGEDNAERKAKELAEKLVLEAEHFKAKIASPKGKFSGKDADNL